MTKYNVTLTRDERERLETLIQKGGKGYQVKRAQILLKLDKIPENKDWTYNRIQDAYSARHSTIAGLAKRLVFEGLDSALNRKDHSNHRRKMTGEVEAALCAIACSEPPAGKSRWTMQMIADKLIELKVVDSISDTAVCNAMKKTRLSRGL
jgi:hypothetical protein